MNDFLTRMAKRSRGEAAMVEPRLPSLFGPLAEAGQRGKIEPRIQDQRKSAQYTEIIEKSVNPAMAKDQPASAVSIDPVSRQPDQRNEETRTLAEPWGNSYESINHAVPAASESNRAVERKQQAGGTNRPVPLPPFTADKPQETASTENTRKSFDSAKAMRTQQASLPLVPVYPSKHALPQQAIIELPIAMEQDLKQEKQEPTVHINIGRIEVRARTSAEAPAPLPTRPKPQKNFSLNEYLKRSGGMS